MPHQCCTCHDLENSISTSVEIPDKDTLKNLKNITDLINRDSKNDSKLTSALNRLENFIKEIHRLAPTRVQTHKRRRSLSHSDDSSMNVKIQRTTKPPIQTCRDAFISKIRPARKNFTTGSILRSTSLHPTLPNRSNIH